MSDRLLSCEHCRFWTKLTYGTGECQRRAPIVPIGKPSRGFGELHREWPVTFKDETCGDFSWREAAPVPLHG